VKCEDVGEGGNLEIFFSSRRLAVGGWKKKNNEDAGR
jgi:hypothetical protein